jgi:hypothetical protein
MFHPAFKVALTAWLMCFAGCREESSPIGSSDTTTDAASDTQVETQKETSSQGNSETSPSSDSDQVVDEGPEAPWYPCRDKKIHEGSLVLEALSQVDHYFNPEDRRVVDAPVSFPSQEFSRITLRVELECPADGICDRWDRAAHLFIVEGAGQQDEKAFELVRYITPYGTGMCFELDVTAYASVLSGEKTVRSFIDTWVGPNEPVHGHGWRVSAALYYAPGQPKESLPSRVMDLWGYRQVEVGNGDALMPDVLGPAQIEVPANTVRAELRLLSTGHGQGNADNCAEFCSLRRLFTVGSETRSIRRWRYDCGDNPLGPIQAGTWSLNRNGWCPGAVVEPSKEDVTDLFAPSSTVVVRYDAQTPDQGPYENTCRPQEDPNAVCEGCVFHPNEPGNCKYNGGDHTPPMERVSAHLLLFEK